MIISLPLEVAEFLKNFSNTIEAGGKTYFYLPYWYKIVDGNVFDEISFEDLPKEVVEHIQRERERDKHPDE